MAQPFSDYQLALRQAKLAKPSLLLDRQAFERNLSRVAEQSRLPLRLVVKSLPSLPLLELAMQRLATNRLMCFHWPFLLQLLAWRDDLDILIGKPMPLAAMEHCLEQLSQSQLDKIQWLIDTPQRLQQASKLAQAHQHRLKCSLEVNLGMQRGGFETPESVANAVAQLNDDPLLSFSGVMGYEAHVAKAPFGRVAQAHQKAQAKLQQVLQALPSREGLCINSGGSPTWALHQTHSAANDISLGSMLVKPTDFELPSLQALEPALYVATPVLKRLAGVRLPFVGNLPLGRDRVFLYGGKWMARAEYPSGLKPSRLFGDSSNQQLLTIPKRQALKADDWVFLRPTQSEALMLQFGDLQIYDNQIISESWPVLSAQINTLGENV
ncbi:alanine racemase [Paraferrimonas sedimenticola]|uniref:Alanine racemase n=1 Tax=Paraferrimonas sedimenticola TaxID=375674 RepID=A0AA37VZT7_9GAMM|nr:alanine racemase [Paraferrimonas sedimenticola]GLP97781.1 alanine racemase [Paraferrimonas sedimenticola]